LRDLDNKAVGYYLKVLKLVEKSDYQVRIAMICLNIGMVNSLLSEHDSAIHYLNKGSDIAEKQKRVENVSFAHIS
jgi:hypothetical protein